eukprot:scaffold148_cov78-Phaeocystis_antarctica.AAC.8
MNWLNLVAAVAAFALVAAVAAVAASANSAAFAFVAGLFANSAALAAALSAAPANSAAFALVAGLFANSAALAAALSAALSALAAVSVNCAATLPHSICGSLDVNDCSGSRVSSSEYRRASCTVLASSAAALAGGGSWHGSTELEANKPASRVAAAEEAVGSCGSLMDACKDEPVASAEQAPRGCNPQRRRSANLRAETV